MGTTLLAILPVSYFCCRYLHLDVYWMFYISIAFSLAAQFVRARFVRVQAGLDMKRFTKDVVLTVITVTIVSAILPLVVRITAGEGRPVWISLSVIALSIVSTCITAFCIGMTRTERKHTLETIVKIKNKILCRQ